MKREILTEFLCRCEISSNAIHRKRLQELHDSAEPYVTWVSNIHSLPTNGRATSRDGTYARPKGSTFSTSPSAASPAVSGSSYTKVPAFVDVPSRAIAYEP